MRQLIDHPLDAALSKAYLKEQLNEINTLCSHLLKEINWEEGRFFTQLPEKANLSHINQFERGGILPQNRERGKKGSYRLIPAIEGQIARYLFDQIHERQLSAIFDDVTRRPTDKNHPELLDLSATYEDELYYLLQKERATREIIEKCLEKSNAFWHSLCLLTKSRQESQTFTLQIINDLCHHAQIVMIGAYDGEGYIFWEKKRGSEKQREL